MEMGKCRRNVKNCRSGEVDKVNSISIGGTRVKVGWWEKT